MQPLQPPSPWPARRCTLQRIRAAEGRRRVRARPADLPHSPASLAPSLSLRACQPPESSACHPSRNAQHTILQPVEAPSSMTAERTETVRLHQVLTQRCTASSALRQQPLQRTTTPPYPPGSPAKTPVRTAQGGTPIAGRRSHG